MRRNPIEEVEMFGKNSYPKHNREVARESSSGESSPWVATMADVPEFDARENEKPKTDVSPEMIKDLQKLGEQLEKMGANPDLIKNPAFSRILRTKISYCNIEQSNPYSLEAEEGKSNNLRFSGEIIEGRYRQAKAEFDMGVDEKGNVVVSTGNAERRNIGDSGSEELVNMYEENTFSPLKNGGFEVFSDKVHTSIFEEHMVRKEGGVEVEFSRSNAYERNHQQYDADGNEKYHEMTTYEPLEFGGEANNNQHWLENEFLRQIESATNCPKYVNRHELAFMRSEKQRLQIDTSLHMRRNEDGTTMSVQGIYEGKKIEHESIPIDNEHGIADLSTTAHHLSSDTQE